jgi:hypothetical protein
MHGLHARIRPEPHPPAWRLPKIWSRDGRYAPCRPRACNAFAGCDTRDSHVTFVYIQALKASYLLLSAIKIEFILEKELIVN